MFDESTKPGDGADLSARGLTLVRGGRRVLDAVDLDVRAGEIVALIGPNGAGKTTLLECLAGLRRPDAGEVRHDGRVLARFADACRVFAFMPDAAEPPTELTVAEQLAYAVKLGGAPRALVDGLTEALGIAPLRSARAAALSRGERRRVALFEALCTRRPVVVLDEPFGAFDPLQLRDVLGVLRGRAAAGVAILASVHQMSDAEKIADRVLLLRGGRVVAFDTLAALKTRAGLARGTLEDVFLTLLGAESAEAHARS